MLWSIERHFGGFGGQRPIVVPFVLFFVVAAAAVVVVVFVLAVVDNLYAHGYYHPLLLHHLQDQLWWLCQLANEVVEAKIKDILGQIIWVFLDVKFR